MANLQKLVVMGAGGLGSEVVWAAENRNANSPTFEILGYCDDDSAKKGNTFFGYPVLGNPEEVDAMLPEKPGFVCAIGNNRRRAQIVQRLMALNWTPVTVVEPSAIIARDVRIGLGTYIAAGSTLSPNAQVGSHVILNLNCMITHDNLVEDYVQICPGASLSGFSVVKTGAVVGSNAVVAPCVSIGEWSTLGANSFAVESVPDGATAIGIPARVMFRAEQNLMVAVFQLHHIGYLVADIPGAADEFAARFGYVVESPVIADPVQTAHVQLLRQPGAGHWLELIAPIDSESKLSKALERGGGWHHVCYEVPNMTQACQQLRDQGLLPLGSIQPAKAFSGRSLAWFMDRAKLLVELVESGPGDFSLANLGDTIRTQP